MKLHEAIDAVLADRPAGMSTRELADEIERRGLYLKGDGKPASPGQVKRSGRQQDVQGSLPQRPPGSHLPRVAPPVGQVSFATYIRSISWRTDARTTKARHAEARRPVGGQS